MTAPYVAPRVVVRNYFGRWRRHDTNRWSRIHWFRKGVPACGITEPLGGADFDLPSEPILTCVACQRINRAAMLPTAGAGASS